MTTQKTPQTLPTRNGNKKGWPVTIAWLSGTAIVISVIVNAYTQSSAKDCTNAFIGSVMANQCADVTAWHTLSQWGIVIGIVACVCSIGYMFIKSYE